MTPARMAEVMALNHPGGLGWSADGLATMLAMPTVHAIAGAEGFALLRVTGPEAELLTIQVHPDAQGRGQGRALLERVLERAQAASVTEVHLEVARDNHPALGLYQRAGFETVGARPDYYRAPGLPPVDAILMRRALEPSGARTAPETGSRET